MKEKSRKRPGSKIIKTINRAAIPPSQRLMQKPNISIEQAQLILYQNGINIEKDDVAKVLELMYQLANLIVNQNFKK
ncbi:hypothetical protein HDC90_004916 [Pedobacter sp. AK013]|uniref:hypothetical protein n=1 Tax=Pedobacter sp. AK013 TaxID=2723071 RepID=UPI00161FC9DB|nr:hypothetical protein [Pedobacter sp. AK013]MBB6240248.1 hypothetical protein [Pedobacter sp. AK013]